MRWKRIASEKDREKGDCNFFFWEKYSTFNCRPEEKPNLYYRKQIVFMKITGGQIGVWTAEAQNKESNGQFQTER
jgi:hypothetical protein